MALYAEQSGYPSSGKTEGDVCDGYARKYGEACDEGGGALTGGTVYDHLGGPDEGEVEEYDGETYSDVDGGLEAYATACGYKPANLALCLLYSLESAPHISFFLRV